MGFVLLLVQSAVLGASAFGIGMLPLSFTFSKRHTDALSTLGMGLLLGAALGVIIPEGIETLAESLAPSAEFPTVKLAFALLAGFTFMLVMENTLSTHAHSHPGAIPLKDTTVEFDAELSELGLNNSRRSVSPDPDTDARARAYALTLGLVTHGLSDGLALGISALSENDQELSLIVFLALLLHKAPTTLALSTSLLSMALPRAQCKRHIAIFSASTPAGALVSYALFAFLGVAGDPAWTGLAILFSGGSFLYIATVLQSPSHGQEVQEIGRKTRAALIVLGMFIPLVLGAIVGHGHGPEHQSEHGSENAG